MNEIVWGPPAKHVHKPVRFFSTVSELSSVALYKSHSIQVEAVRYDMQSVSKMLLAFNKTQANYPAQISLV